ncbi:PP2C family serine/threonine-protein phosphatase [Idiomarina abyssalis]|uniref:PP2C family serine/threonine-protein phosphatase n=1 Tax=Idiomarina abyssalis TaxID=86102 RepID=UPI003A8CE89D
MKLVATGSSVIGPAHQQDDTPNQDAVLVQGYRQGWCIAVCDGLGSRALSHQGSRLAGHLVRSTVRKWQHTEPSSLSISQQIQQQWVNKLGKDYSSYETTCLWAWADAQGQVKAAQVGDGLLLARCNGQFSVITPERDGFGNQTQTLARAGNDDWSTIECTLTIAGDGVLLMTDGISDDLLPEQLEAFFETIFQQLKNSNKRRCKRWLTQELIDWSTPKHGDDKSIAGIFKVE